MTRPLKPGSNRRQINRGQGRIRNLERRQIIQYDAENVGDWLYVRATSVVDGDLTELSVGVVFDGVGVGITNTADGGGNTALVVQGGDTDDDVYVAFGGDSDGSPFYLQGSDYLHALVHSYVLLDVAGTGGDVGKDSELNMSLGQVTLAGNEGIDIVSNPGLSVADFPDIGGNSVQILAGDSSDFGTVYLAAFDKQATPTFTGLYVGYIDFGVGPTFPNNGVTAQILGGQTFTVVGSDGSPIFQVLALEQGGTVHIKTGTTVHADL